MRQRSTRERGKVLGATRGNAALTTAVLTAATLGGLAAAAPAVAAPLAAQPRLPTRPLVRDLAPQQRRPERKPEKNDDVPPAYRPPPGMCRIWLDNVPPAQQPAPTDCPSAVRNRPPNARVLFGDDYARRSEGADVGTVGVYALTEAHGERAHGPMAGDAPWVPVAFTVPDSTPRRARAAAGHTARPAARPQPEADEEWEAGYAAGYRDAMQGRRPRVRGVDRLAPNATRAPGRGAAGSAADDDYDTAARAYQSYGGYGAGPGVVAGTGTGTAVVVPPSADPRYFNNGRNPPPGRANGVCLDRDADGWCDDPRFGAPTCRDRDGDGRCDDVPALAAAPYPSTLPDMRAGLAVQRGQGSAEALRWLGTTEVIARVADLRGTGSPSRVTWLDANTGALLQVWSDRDGDGTADRVEVYRDGRRVKFIGR